MARVALDVVDVRSPCNQSWDAMAGTGQVRFCPHCQKSVHTLSAMPTADAERLLCSGAGGLCVRFEASQDGKIRTLDYESAPARKRRIWPLWTLAGVCATAAAAAMNVVLARPRPFIGGRVTMGAAPPFSRQVIMGDVSCPGTPTTQPATKPAAESEFQPSSSENPSPNPSAGDSH
jgi:hypothetical protein